MDEIAAKTGRPQDRLWPLPMSGSASPPKIKRADRRIPLLLETPAVVRWIAPSLCSSLLISRSDLGSGHAGWLAGAKLDGLSPAAKPPEAQPCHPDWARSLRDQCAKSARLSFGANGRAYPRGGVEAGGASVGQNELGADRREAGRSPSRRPPPRGLPGSRG